MYYFTVQWYFFFKLQFWGYNQILRVYKKFRNPVLYCNGSKGGVLVKRAVQNDKKLFLDWYCWFNNVIVFFTFLLWVGVILALFVLQWWCASDSGNMCISGILFGTIVLHGVIIQCVTLRDNMKIKTLLMMKFKMVQI